MPDSHPGQTIAGNTSASPSAYCEAIQTGDHRDCLFGCSGWLNCSNMFDDFGCSSPIITLCALSCSCSSNSGATGPYPKRSHWWESKPRLCLDTSTESKICKMYDVPAIAAGWGLFALDNASLVDCRCHTVIDIIQDMKYIYTSGIYYRCYILVVCWVFMGLIPLDWHGPLHPPWQNLGLLEEQYRERAVEGQPLYHWLSATLFIYFRLDLVVWYLDNLRFLISWSHKWSMIVLKWVSCTTTAWCCANCEYRQRHTLPQSCRFTCIDTCFLPSCNVRPFGHHWTSHRRGASGCDAGRFQMATCMAWWIPVTMWI